MSWIKDKYGVMAIGTAASLLLDQLTKALVVAHFPPEASRPIVRGFFELYHAHNPGAAFGLFKGNPLPFFLVVSTVAVGFIIYYFIRLERHHLLLAASLSMILGGALGNMVDRLRHGFVIDFLRFYVGEFSWPTFNVADIVIVVGVAVFALDMIRADAKASRAPGE